MTAPRAGRWSERLWAEMRPMYQAILAHPFITGLVSGELDPAAFGQFLVQDAHYLRDYARSLAIVGAKAADQRDTGTLTGHAAAAIAAELTVNAELSAGLAGDLTQPPTPTTAAYGNFLLAAAYGSGFAEGLAAVLPCYWLYAEVGAELARSGSPDPRYQAWIDSYAGDEYAAVVAAVLDIVDRTGEALSQSEEARCRQHARTSSRYEWMFWDAAYRREGWPI